MGGSAMEGDLCERVGEATRNLMRGLALKLVDVEIAREGGRLFLRIAIDRKGGVTVEDCARASGLIGQVLDREGIITDQYVLEVMSAGLDRRLKRPADFENSIGKRVRVSLKQPYEGKRNLTGILVGAGEGIFSLELGEELLELKYDSLAGARLDPELPW